MLGSHGMDKKQKPWEESIRIPFLLHYPAMFGRSAQELGAVLDIPDIMPTLLGLCDLPFPESVEGLDYSGYLQGGADPSDRAALLACYHPFGQWLPTDGGREYRGLRTSCYTYVRALDGPWLLYDNETDPYQLSNLVHRPECAGLREMLDARLQTKLDEQNDTFLSGLAYIDQWGYPIDETGTVPWVW
jgi:arylsulfatase A-like enzyme